MAVVALPFVPIDVVLSGKPTTLEEKNEGLQQEQTTSSLRKNLPEPFAKDLGISRE